MQPQFIVIEGIEGAGKSTVINHIIEFLDSYNINHIVTREPGGTKLAEDIRNIIKSDYANETIYAETEVLLLYAARLQLVNNVIKPALADNTWVIGDRHDLSTIAYQVGGRGLNPEFINTIKNIVLGDFSYDFCLYLDIDPELGLARAQKRGQLDRIEQENIDFFINTRNKYLELANKTSNIVLVDASKTEQEVKQSILEILKSKYNI